MNLKLHEKQKINLKIKALCMMQKDVECCFRGRSRRGPAFQPSCEMVYRLENDLTKWSLEELVR